MANIKKARSSRLHKLVLSEALIVCYVTYFAALSLSWLGFIKTPHSVDTLVNTFLYSVSILPANLALGLYEFKLREPLRGIIRRLFISVGFGFFCVTFLTSTVLVKFNSHIYYAPIAVAMLLMALTIFRVFIHSTDAYFKKPNVLILGAGVRASVIENRMRRDVDRSHFELVGFVAMSGDNREEGIKREKLIDLVDMENLDKVINEYDVEEIIIANDQRRGVLPTDQLFKAKLSGIKITELLDFLEREMGFISVDLMYPSWVIYRDGFESKNEIRKSVDYLMNMTLAVILLIVLCPVMLFCAIAVHIEGRFTTRSPTIYRQTRVGKGGRSFDILKFRSMGPDAEKNGAKWAAKDDSRVTEVGKVLRKYRLDELPQLWNILKGDMAFIGPRPERPEICKELSEKIPYYQQRHNVKPGLAGWAQLNYPYGASVKDSLEKLKFDLYYVKHQSLLLDLHILIRTTEVVMFGKGR